MEASFLITSFIAGVLTILAPCVLPLIPIIVSGSAGQKDRIKPIVITVSLMISVVVFTLLLKASTVLLGVPASVWPAISGTILIIFGLVTLFPELWEKISLKLNLSNSSNKLLGESARREGIFGSILIGAALGPVFTSCSPTYAVIVATVLPSQFSVGLIYLIVYALGLGLMLLLVSFAGQGLVRKLGWATDPKGVFKRVVGVIFLLIGIAIIAGFDKDLQAWLVERGVYDWISNLEERLRQ